VRLLILLAFSTFAFSVFANDPVFDSREAEDQFIQATQDAQVIDQACAQTRTDRKTCYQRATPITAQCREQLKQQYFDSRSANETVDRQAFATDLKNCVQDQITSRQ
jgi:hypothetical protein